MNNSANLVINTGMDDHFTICQLLDDLPQQDIISLGQALGLSLPSLEKKKTFPSDMVHAWLLKQDRVLDDSGEPSVRRLVVALEKIRQGGVAKNVNKHFGIDA